MFTGSIVAIVTPMDEKGNVCRASLKKLIDYHVASGTSAIVSVGTTGESATLNHDEHAEMCIRDRLAPLLVAIVLAYLLEWPTVRLQSIGCSRRWATSIVLVVFVGILLLLSLIHI